MFNTNYKTFPRVRFLGGSSTLVLGSATAANQFFFKVAKNLFALERINWHCPEVVKYENSEDISKIGASEWMSRAEKSLECPREIMYQTWGKLTCLSGKLVFLPGITDELVKKFDNQLLTSRSIEEAIIMDVHDDYEYNASDEPIAEYPKFDEFGNPTEISWLREYALRADELSWSRKVDIFLNLEWNKPKQELPTPFWLTFDRIFEIEHDPFDGKITISRIR